MSEKIPGIRVFWDGVTLHTSHQRIIPAPSHFLQQLPPISFEGQLWYHSFKLSPCRCSDPVDWSKTKLVAFDAPLQCGMTYEERLNFLQESFLCTTLMSNWSCCCSILEQQLDQFDIKVVNDFILRYFIKKSCSNSDSTSSHPVSCVP